MILNKENTFTEQNRFLVYSDQLNATLKQTLDTVEKMISRSTIQTFEDEGETITAADASYLASLTVDGKSVQNGTPTPSAPVDVQVVTGINLAPIPTFTNNEVTLSRPIPINTAFAISFTPLATRSYALYLYQPDGTYINGVSGSGTVGTRAVVNVAPKSVEVGKIMCYYDGGRDDIIDLQVETGTDTPYTPYGSIGLKVGSTITPINLNGNVLVSLPLGTKDVLTVDSVGYVVMEKRVGVVDLGTLNWVYNSSYGMYSTGLQSLIKAPAADVKANALCTNHDIGTWGEVFAGGTTSNLLGVTNTAVVGISTTETVPATFKTSMAGMMLYYELATPQTIDLGYIDIPAIPDGAEISITAQITPTIAAKWWTKNQSDVAAAFGAVSSDLATLQGKISALDARVTALESANAKSLVLEKLETSKEVPSEEADEQEEMNLDEE